MIAAPHYSRLHDACRTVAFGPGIIATQAWFKLRRLWQPGREPGDGDDCGLLLWIMALTSVAFWICALATIAFVIQAQT